MLLSISEIRSVEAQYGSPFYLFDEASFVDNYRELEDAFRRIYPQYHIAYSYKTNYTPYVAKTVKKLGGYAEVVSGMEYRIAKKLGYEDRDIVFNGPHKGLAGEEAFLNGCIINADSLQEVKAYCDLAQRHPHRAFECGLRVNLDVGQNFISRFGMDEQSVAQAFELVKSVPNLEIVGLHCHISRCRGIEAWRSRARQMLTLADRHFQEPPKYIDLGSGMFGSMEAEFARQFDGVPTYEEYAAAVAEPFAERYGNCARKPILFTEPGTTLINRFIDFYGKVEAIKTVGTKSFAVLNCSIHNLGEVCTLKQLPVNIIRASSGGTEYTDLDLTGYTCLEQDIMRKSYSGCLCEGDAVRFGNVGGYSNVLKPPFIRPNCAMLAKNMSGEIVLIKRAETDDDILHTYVCD